jgi:hypothetical protein
MTKGARSAAVGAALKFCSVLALAALPQTLAAAPPGKALAFDGVDDFAVVPHDSALNFGPTDEVTFEVWLRPTATPAVWHAFGKRSDCGSNQGIHYQLARDPFSKVSFGGTGCGFALDEDLPLDTWSHIAVTVDGSRFRFYLNGELAGERACQLGSQNNADLIIGNSDNCADRFPGQIDDLRIWRRVRSAAEIADSFGCELPAVPDGLVGYWAFDEAPDSQVLVDASGSGFDGQLGASAAPGSDDPVRTASTLPLPCGVLKDGFEVTP